MNKKLLMISAATLALALVPMLAPAVAQAEGAEGTTDRIVVTAQYREQNLQDTPLSITAVSADQLTARSQTSLVDVTAQAPNVTLTEAGGVAGIAMQASIRGVGQQDDNPALEPGVGVYIDDVYLALLTGASLDLLDLERVEVLRGPQGTLLGRNSIGGAIRLISRTPEGDGSGFVEATYGENSRVGARGSADFAIADNLFARVSAVSKSQDGYVDRLDYGCLNPGSSVAAVLPVTGDCKLGELGSIGYDAIRGMLRFVPNDRIDLLLTADYIDDERSGAPEVLFVSNNAGNPNVATPDGTPLDERFICGRFCNFAAETQSAGDFTILPAGPTVPVIATARPDTRMFEGSGLSAKLTIDLADDLEFVSITAHREYEADSAVDGDYGPAQSSLGYSATDHEFFSQEFRLNGALGDLAEYTLGAYYSDQESIYYVAQDIRFAPIPLQFVGDDPVPADSKAVFGTVILHPFENLNVTGGLRYTEETKEYTFVRLTFDGAINPFLDPLGELNGFTGSYKGDQLDYRVSVDYRWSDALMTYATVSTGFKGGGIGPRPFNAAQVQPFDPEQLTAYEIGARTDFWNGRGRVNASAFFNDYTDIVLTFNSCPQFGGPGPCALPQNAGDAEVTGLEIEAFLEPVDGLQVDASYSLLNFDYTFVNPSTGLADPDGVPFNRDLTAPFSPETQWSLGAQYMFDLGQAGTLTPRIDVFYRDEVFTNANNTSTGQLDDYTLANGRLTWENRDGDVSVALEVTNLADEYYYRNIFETVSAGIAAGQVGRPREWAITVAKRF